MGHSVLKNQPHGGVIKKREEPYRTLLRAKPRDRKSHLERFIVLGDADPKHVEERLGSELISHQVMGHLNPNERIDNDLKDQAETITIKKRKSANRSSFIKQNSENKSVNKKER